MMSISLLLVGAAFVLVIGHAAKAWPLWPAVLCLTLAMLVGLVPLR